MAGELQIDSSAFTGSDLYALLYNSDGEVCIVATALFEAFVAANIGNYDIVLTEQGPGAGYFIGDMPLVAGGVYGFAIRVRAGGAPAITDLTIGSGTIQWDGTDELSLFDINTVAFPAGAIAFTYTVTDVGTGLPIDNVKVWITTDVAGTNTVWSGFTDAFGIAYDVEGNLPMLDAGTYQFWCEKVGYSFTSPDAEVVS